MNKKLDVRWHQRLNNYTKVLSQLTSAVDLTKKGSLRPIEQQGLIKSFEFTFELAWNLMKDYFEYQGIISLIGSRDLFREAFQKGLIDNGDIWMQMIASRNKTSHTYNQSTANEIIKEIVENYHQLFLNFEKKMLGLKNEV